MTGQGGPLSVAVDAGGSFTDIVPVDRATGRRWEAKASSTPADRSRAVAERARHPPARPCAR